MNRRGLRRRENVMVLIWDNGEKVFQYNLK